MIKHKKIILGLIVSFIIIVSLVVFGIGTNAYVLQNKKSSIKNNNMISILLETKADSGEYAESSNNSWPTSGYEFNSELSKCVNGGTLTWDSTNNKVMFDGEASDKCYVYFNKINTLSEYIKGLYTGVQGENNLYLHDSTLTNGAGDGSYRYAGSSDTTNNFVCFGYDSTDGSCPTDYLYRIIGVFDDQVKLIKYDYAKASLLGTNGDYSNTYSRIGYGGTNKGSNATTEIGVYYWNKNSGTANNTWSNSLFNKTNLNTNYLNNMGSNWSNKIATHTWKVGGNTYANLRDAIVTTAYQNEITNPATNTTYDAKVGLMYVSDYGYAAAPSAWSTTLVNYDSSSVTSVNWMYMGLVEWAMAPLSNDSTLAFYVSYAGSVNCFTVDSNFAGRPVFNLIDSVKYNGGIGTESDPIRIN